MAPVIRVVERLIAPLRRRVLLMVGRAVVRLINDAPATQLVQVEALNGEILDDVERVQQYGISSCPPLGARAVLLSVGGMRQHPVVIAVEAPEYRPVSSRPGEVMLYTTLDRSHEKRVAGVARSDRHHLRLDAAPTRHAEIELLSRLGGNEARVRMRSHHITLSCGRSSIRIDNSGITMRAPRIDREKVE